MKRPMLARIVMCGIVGTVALFSSCSEPQKVGMDACEGVTGVAEPLADTGDVTASRRRDGKATEHEVDWEAFYKSVLRAHGGVEDFSGANLIKLMDAEHPSLRGFSAKLLAHRNERWAIPRLVEALDDEVPLVRIQVADALLKMDNSEGIPVLLAICEKASKEYEQGNYRNRSDMMSAAQVLARAGEVSAIPYLRMLSTYEQSWGVRIKAVRSLATLYERQPSVLKDIASRMEDQDERVRKEATGIVDRVMKTGSAIEKRE